MFQPAGESERGERAEQGCPGGEQDGGADGVAGSVHEGMLAQKRADRNGAGDRRLLRERICAGPRPAGMPRNVPIPNVSGRFLALA